MAPIMYCLNKNYTLNYGGRNSVVIGDSVMKRPNHLTASTDRRYDSSKSFHWLWTRPGIILAACIGLGLGSSFYNVYSNELPPSWFYTMADPDSKALYFDKHMTRIWTHLAVFAIGLIAGVECRRASKNVLRGYKGTNICLISHNSSLSKHYKSQSSSASSLPVISSQNVANSKTPSDLNSSNISINIHSDGGSNENINRSDDGILTPSSIGGGGSDIGIYNSNNNDNDGLRTMLLDIIGFLAAITTMSAIIFSTHDWSMNDLPKPLVAGIFDASSRFLWSLAMIWILYMVSVPDKNRNFSLLARSLGHPGMVCLGKLSFLIFIIHPFVHTTVLAIQEQPIYSSWLMLFHILIGNMTITVILASLVSLFVEMPCRNLFRRCGTSLLLTQSTIGSGSTAATSAS